MKLTEPTKTLIQTQFELAKDTPSLSDEAFFDILADQVAYMLENRLEELMSLMYTMDIDERKVAYALSLSNAAPANTTIAQLIIDRQVQRMETKAKYKQNPTHGWDDF